MERSTSSLSTPSPLVALPCGSMSMTSVFFSATARQAPRLMAVVVLPTPPFWFAMAMMRDTLVLTRGGWGGGMRREYTRARARVERYAGREREDAGAAVFHVEQLSRHRLSRTQVICYAK